MKKINILASACLGLIILPLLSACSSSSEPSNHTAIPPSTGQIYLYGEMHGVDVILNKELELWSEYYQNGNMRHLFIEYPYYTAEFLNIWMKSDDDKILDAIYDDWVGTEAHTPAVKEFYQKIKSDCPETVFHGTDVGHQYNTIGKRYLNYLEEKGLKDSEHYLLAQEAIAQGKRYYGNGGHIYRENMMAENFIREFDKLGDENVMGIYGNAHTGLEALDHTNSVPCMASQLYERYGNSILSEDLSLIVKDIEPVRVDKVTIGEKEYTAPYYGEQDLGQFADYAYRAFWQLENAYAEFKDRPKTGDVLPYDNYPMLIETGDVFVIDYVKTDGSVERKYYRSDGNDWNGKPVTEEFTVEYASTAQ